MVGTSNSGTGRNSLRECNDTGQEKDATEVAHDASGGRKIGDGLLYLLFQSAPDNPLDALKCTVLDAASLF